MMNPVPIIRKYQTIIQTQKRNKLDVGYRQALVFKQIKDCNELLGIKRSRTSISTINFITNLTNIIDKFPRLRGSS